MERQKFEESWKDAFRDAEVSPSESLWTNIELELEKSDGGKMKRRILFYKMLAAASVIFAMTFAGLGLYYMNESNNAARSLAEQNELKNSQSPEVINDQEASPTLAEKNNAAIDNAGNENDNNGKASQLPITASENNNGTKSKEARSAESQTASASGNDDQNKTKQSAAREELNAPDSNIAANTVDKKTSNNDKRITGTSRLDQSVATNENNTKTTPDEAASSKVAGNFAENNTITRNDGNGVVAGNDKKVNQQSSKAIAGSSVQSSGNTVVAKDNYAGILERNENAADAKSPRPALANTHKITTVDLPTSKADPVQLMLAKLDEREKALREGEKKEKKNGLSDEKLWTSLGFAAGSFTSTTASTPALAQSTGFMADNALRSNTVVQDQTRAAGVSYSVGVNVGARISNRWVLQGGVNYLTQSSEYSSHTALRSEGKNFAAYSVNELKNSGNADLVTVAEYDVNNNLQYLNIPLQAGYLIVNKKIGFQLNAGISTDLFIQNVITPEGTFEKTTQSSGADSPYRAVNFSGLMGTEVSYRIGQRYRVSLNPGIRYPLSSIYKSDVGIDATPFTFDVGLRFRYIFH